MVLMSFMGLIRAGIHMLKKGFTSDACNLIRATAPNPNPLGKEFGLVRR